MMRAVEIAPPGNLYELIDKMKVRTPMYLGGSTITQMASCIDGYFIACWVNGIEEELQPDFSEFHDFVASHFRWAESTAGWKNILLQECGTEESALQSFFDLFDLFRQVPTKQLPSLPILHTTPDVVG